MANYKLYSFKKYNREYKLDVGDKIMDNGNCVLFLPKDETKLPWSNYSRNSVELPSMIVKELRAGNIQNLNLQVKDGINYYIVTEVDLEVRDKKNVDEMNLLLHITLENNIFNKKYEFKLEESVIVRETDKLIYTEKYIGGLQQHPKVSLDNITRRYSDLEVVTRKYDSIGDIQSLMIEKEELEIQNKIDFLVNKLDTLRKFKNSKGF